MTLKVIELFSGIGSQARALENLGLDHEIVATCDWDVFSIISYAIVHKYDSFKKEYSKWLKCFGSDNVVVQELEREREREFLNYSININLVEIQRTHLKH